MSAVAESVFAVCISKLTAQKEVNWSLKKILIDLLLNNKDLKFCLLSSNKLVLWSDLGKTFNVKFVPAKMMSSDCIKSMI